MTENKKIALIRTQWILTFGRPDPAPAQLPACYDFRLFVDAILDWELTHLE